MKYIIITFLTISSLTLAATSAPVRVGNGDRGDDLQYFIKISKGKLETSRYEAFQLASKLNLKNLNGFSSINKELKYSDLYLMKPHLDKKKLIELGNLDEQGDEYYARTFTSALSPVYFYQTAMNLDNKRLVQLHIHEALHKVLVKPYNVDETLISKLVKAITAPDSNFDTIQKIYLDLTEDTSRGVKSRSMISIGYNHFESNSKELEDNIESLSLIESRIFPFYGKLEHLGFGVKLGFVKLKDEMVLGPMNFRFLYKLPSNNKFHFIVYMGNGILNTAYSEQDAIREKIYQVGATVKTRKMSHQFLYNLEYTFPSLFEDKNIRYEFGSSTRFSMTYKRKHNAFTYGLGLRFNYLKEFKTNTVEINDAFTLSLFPTFSYVISNDVEVALELEKIVGKTKDIDFTSTGDLIGLGAKSNIYRIKFNYHF
jgi:hypothetical protein